MGWPASRIVLALVMGGVCGALPACESSTVPSRCGRSYVTPVYWGASASAGAVAVGGAWYVGPGAVDGPYGYGDWYDPGDEAYDPGSNSGGIVADPNGNDGSGWDQPDDGSGDPGSDNGDTSADTSGGDSSGDTSSEGLTRLHLHDVSASPRPSSPASPSSSAPSPSVAPGCYACTMGCRTDATASATGRQAIGVSDASYDDACASAVRTLAQWSHDTHRERLASCQQIVTASR